MKGCVGNHLFSVACLGAEPALVPGMPGRISGKACTNRAGLQCVSSSLKYKPVSKDTNFS